MEATTQLNRIINNAIGSGNSGNMTTIVGELVKSESARVQSAITESAAAKAALLNQPPVVAEKPATGWLQMPV